MVIRSTRLVFQWEGLGLWRWINHTSSRSIGNHMVSGMELGIDTCKVRAFTTTRHTTSLDPKVEEIFILIWALIWLCSGVSFGFALRS